MIRRCNPAERTGFAKYADEVPGGLSGSTPKEPAMGTVDERLDILIRRLGGCPRIRLTKAERLEWAEALDGIPSKVLPLAQRKAAKKAKR